MLSKRILGLGLSAILLNACAFEKAELSPELKSEIEKSNAGKIPLENFFKEADYGQLKISPDGKYIAAIYPKNGRNSLAILDADLTKVIYTAQFESDRHIFSYEWVNDTRILFQAGKKYGYLDGRNSDRQTYFVDFDGKNFRNFFQDKGAFYSFERTIPDEPEWIVMAKYYYADRGRPIAVKVNVNNGREKLLAQPPIKQGGFLADRQGEVNVAIENSEEEYDKSEIYYRLDSKSDWTKLDYPVKGEGRVVPLQMDVKNKILYVQSNLETGRDAIYKLDLKTAKTQLVTADDKVDILEVLWEDDKIVGAAYMDGLPSIEIIDKDSAFMKLYKDIAPLFPGQYINNIDLTRDKSMALFRIASDVNPGEFYKYDIKGKKVIKIANARDWIDPNKMSPMKPVTVKARDGLEIPSYLTIPKDGPQKNLPTVLVLHGGPHGPRDLWGFDQEVQFLASRGYAVMQVNFRGSGGYGKKFEEMGYRQWGLAMQDDVTDATKWLIDQGISDKNRICLYGGSYGGYASLMGVVREPDMYRCAINYVGVSDLTIQRDFSDTSSAKAGEHYIKKALGDDEADLKKRSALYNIDKIKAPIFIVHGIDDQRVPFRNAERLREALDAAKKPYEWMAKPSEGHGFQQPANRFEFYYRMQQFLDKHTKVGH